MYCQKCGNQLEKKDEYCAKCGNRVETPETIIKKIKEDFDSLDYESALKKTALLEKNENYAKYMFLIKGDINFILGDYEEAVRQYSAAERENWGWDIFLTMAVISINAGDENKALEYLSGIDEKTVAPEMSFIYSGKFSDKESALAEIFLYEGILRKSRGDYTKAVEVFEKAAKLKPGNDFVLANLGDVYFKNDNYDEAIKVYTEAVKSSPDSFKKSHMYNDLGLAYFRKGIIKAAVENFKNSIIINPENENAIHNLGIIYVKSGMREEVKNDYKEFLKYDSGVDIVYNLSRFMADFAGRSAAAGTELDIMGNSPAMKKVKEMIVKAAKVDTTVFIEGGNGTGKELAARSIHSLSGRAGNPFVVVNCGALSETLLETELFGHVKGAFTGAVKEKKGRFETADGGVVFLDEIGDITPAMQVKLLRFVQEKEFEQVGSNETIKVDVRIITATNRDIRKLVSEGLFREDLFYRLYVLPIRMPPLRERGGDIILLAKYFLSIFSEKYNKEFKGFSAEAERIINNYSWPGNVRQLENVMERIAAMFDGSIVMPEHIPEEIFDRAETDNKENGKFEAEKKKINEALKSVNYSKTKAAGVLNISRVALWKKMKKLGMC
ncbi:MAG: sigma 54-interacting transcriptional regulator [Candidatus Goldiibacteriota bacterium]